MSEMNMTIKGEYLYLNFFNIKLTDVDMNAQQILI